MDNKQPLDSVDLGSGQMFHGRLPIVKNKSQLKRLAKFVLGPNARLWNRDGRIVVGTEYGSEKSFLVTVDKPQEAVSILVSLLQPAVQSPTTTSELQVVSPETLASVVENS